MSSPTTINTRRFAAKLVFSLLALALIITLSKGSSLHRETEASSNQMPKVGLELLHNLQTLPSLRNNILTYQISTHDKTGGNSDYGGRWDCSLPGSVPWPEGLEPYHYEENGKWVIFDEEGPGIVTRMRFRAGDASLSFYFDGEPTPRLTSSVADLISGEQPPFLKPLVNGPSEKSGGHISLVPLQFSKSLKITLDRPAGTDYYAIDFQRLDPTFKIQSFTGGENVSAIVTKWQNLGSDPKPLSGNISKTGTITAVASGQSATLFERNVEGTINAIKVHIPQVAPSSMSADYTSDPGQVASREILSKVRIRAYWDGETSPSVDVPIGSFFGSMFGETEAKALLLGTTTTEGGFYYNYFPMPFNGSVRIEITNDSSMDIASLSFEVVYNPKSYPGLGDSAGYFKAQYNEEVPTTAGSDFQIGQLSGQGQVVGMVLFAHGRRLTPVGFPPVVRNYLEGDPRFYFDASGHPNVYGSGTEDFFGGANYFEKGVFAGPLHGNNFHPDYTEDAYNNPDVYDETGMYRTFLADSLSFRDGADLRIEHGDASIFCDIRSSHPSDYYSTVFWYGLDEPGTSLTDILDIGNVTSEEQHEYSAQAATAVTTESLYYEGDDDDVAVTDGGNSAAGTVEFTVNIDADNQGVVLRRRADHGIRNQEALVYVDGAGVGTWYDPGANVSKRWINSEFPVPSTMTAGKEVITIRVEPQNGILWTAYTYWVFSIAGPAAVGGEAELPDVAGAPLEAGRSSGPGAGALAGGAAAGVIALGGAAWRMRRRRLR